MVILLLFVSKCVPALCFEGELFAVSSDEQSAVGRVGDVPYYIHIVKRDEFLVVVDVAGEEQFVVFSPVECAGDDVEVHLFQL